MLTFHGCHVTRIPSPRLPGSRVERNGRHGKGQMSYVILLPRRAPPRRRFFSGTLTAACAPTLACPAASGSGKKVLVQLNVESLIHPPPPFPTPVTLAFSLSLPLSLSLTLRLTPLCSSPFSYPFPDNECNCFGFRKVNAPG